MKPADEEPDGHASSSGKKPRTKAERRGQTTLFDMDDDKGSQQ